MILVTVFLSILNQMEFYLVKNRKENCHHDHIPFNVKGNGNIVFSVHGTGKFPNQVRPKYTYAVNKFLNPIVKYSLDFLEPV